MDRRRFIFVEGLIGREVDQSYRQNLPGFFCVSIDTKNAKAERERRQHRQDEAVPAGVEVVKTACFSCNTACEVLVFVNKDNGKIIKIEGDPDSPVTQGVLCAKGLAAKDLVDNQERLKHPLRRVGKRGEGKWEEISWDEALSSIAQKLLDFREEFGPQGVAFLEGTRRGWSRVYTRLANAFGAVNHGASGWAQCLWPRLIDTNLTFGKAYTETADFERTNCILNWGVNPPATWPVSAARIMDARQRGAALIVVDPYFSETASKADIWLQLLPGTDTALALAMLHVIIREELYDKEFIASWTTGFPQLREHLKGYTPEWGEAVTRVSADLISKAARLYANSRPASIYRCVALDELHDSLQACRAVSLLAAVTGNIGIPGGNILVSSRGEVNRNTHDFIGYHLLDPGKIPLRRGYEQYPLLCDKLCPVPSAHMPTLWETIATGKPYPVKGALIFGSNAVISYTNTNRVREALDQLEFLVVTDLFMTPTAEQADIVLPASSWLERDNIISSFQTSPEFTIAQQKVTSVGEARSDVDIICDLAKKLGLGEYFWENSTEFYDYLLQPTGLTFTELKGKRRLYAPIKYRNYEENGFATPSGKVELYSSTLKKNQLPPLPVFEEPDKTSFEAEYPYILTSGRLPVYRHTENRQNPLLREISPDPLVLLHPETAKKHQIFEGQMITIETMTGEAEGKAFLTDGIQLDVIRVTPGWGGKGNINRAIPWENCADGIGTVPMRGLQCRISPQAKRGDQVGK